MIIEDLCEAEATVNTRDEDGQTALMLAAGGNTNTKVITALVRAGADVNAHMDNGGWFKSNNFTVLMTAALGARNPEIITALLSAGADAKMEDSQELTALFYAKQNPSVEGTDAYWKLVDASY